MTARTGTKNERFYIMRPKYNTLLAFLVSRRPAANNNDLRSEIYRAGFRVSQLTVYRCLRQLESEGRVERAPVGFAWIWKEDDAHDSV